MTFFLNDKVRKSEIILTKFPFRDSIQSTFIYPGKILSPQPRLSLILLSLGGGTNFKGAIPNLKIISPADSLETIKALESTLNNLDTSVYIRLTGGSNNPIVYNTDYVFDIGKSIKLVDGSDITVISCGSMVYNAIEVSKLLKKQNISCSVINMHTIKPIDKVAIKDACNSKLVVTIEEHNVIGGLGSAVAEELSKYKNKSKFLPIGIQDQYTGGGDYKFLLRKHDLDIEGIFNKIIENYKTT